jgi:hypothetical protein
MCWGARRIVFHRSVVGGALVLSLASILLLWVLVAILRLKRETLRKLIACQKLSTIPLTRWIPLLITLLETSTLTSVATRGLFPKPFPLGIHLLTLVVHHNYAIYRRLKTGVSIGHQLIISIISHPIRSIT